MLTNIKLENFKCFKKLDLKCAPLTLLTGINGTGKSSVFQALLMLRQTHMAGNLPFGPAIVNGDLISVGSDVCTQGSGSTDVRYALASANIPTPYDVSLNVRGTTKTPLGNIHEGWHKTPPIGGDMVYVPAERVGPQVSYDRSDLKAQNKDLGSHGEYAINYLSNNLEDLAHDDHRALGEYTSISDTVDYWLEQLCPGTSLTIEDYEDDKPISAYFSFGTIRKRGRSGNLVTVKASFPAVSVGFGLSYALPVIAALTMPKGTLCLIENPEAHLHPQGQTKVAELAARAANEGVQVLVETHSDHFIDGIRIAVREGILTPKDTAFHYFERRGSEALVKSPKVDSDGRLSEWPVGFFDQYEENLSRLIDPRN